MKYSQQLIEAIQFAESFALNSRLEFITPELLLVGICCRTKEFETLCDSYMVDYQKDLKEPIYATLTEHVPEDIEEDDYNSRRSCCQSGQKGVGYSTCIACHVATKRIAS